MISTKQKSGQILLSFAVAALLLVGAGLPHFGMTTSMDMDGNMTMTDCYMPGMTAICSMTPLQHISEWQKIFTATAQQTTTAVLLLLLALSVVLSQFLVHLLVHKPKERSNPMLRYRYKEKVFDPLRLAFARGKIHSKSF